MSYSFSGIVDTIQSSYNINRVIALSIDGMLAYSSSKYVKKYVPKTVHEILPFLLLPAISAVRQSMFDIKGN